MEYVLFGGVPWCYIHYDAYAEAIKALGPNWWGILTAHGKVRDVYYLGQLGNEDGIMQKASERARSYNNVSEQQGKTKEMLKISCTAPVTGHILLRLAKRVVW